MFLVNIAIYFDPRSLNRKEVANYLDGLTE